MHARKNLLEIDKLTFRTNILQVVEESLIDDLPETGVNIHGNFIEGARWDFKRKQIDDMEHKVAISPFPIVWLEPVFEDEVKKDRMYECPLYKTSQRRGELTTTGHSTNFIMYLLLPSEVNPEHWVRRGSAMLCMTDD
jgi:dynein heavy chain